MLATVIGHGYDLCTAIIFAIKTIDQVQLFQRAQMLSHGDFSGLRILINVGQRGREIILDQIA
jgi:hypothetical protein